MQTRDWDNNVLESFEIAKEKWENAGEFKKLVEEKMSDPKVAEVRIMKGRDRNQPCPCGSGFKYKKCCGVLEPVKDKEGNE